MRSDDLASVSKKEEELILGADDFPTADGVEELTLLIEGGETGKVEIPFVDNDEPLLK